MYQVKTENVIFFPSTLTWLFQNPCRILLKFSDEIQDSASFFYCNSYKQIKKIKVKTLLIFLLSIKFSSAFEISQREYISDVQEMGGDRCPPLTVLDNNATLELSCLQRLFLFSFFFFDIGSLPRFQLFATESFIFSNIADLP